MAQHMPMDFSFEEKKYIKILMRKFKHSQELKKLLMCAYYADRYFTSFICFEDFLRNTYTFSNTIDGIHQYWRILSPDKKEFFGFNTSTIIEGDMLDLENHINEFIRGLTCKRDADKLRKERNISYEYEPRNNNKS